jgi:hypothetical protein
LENVENAGSERVNQKYISKGNYLCIICCTLKTKPTFIICHFFPRKMANMMNVFDAMMSENSTGGGAEADSFDEDLLAQEIEQGLAALDSPEGGDAVLTKDQAEYLAFCRAMANGSAVPTTDLNLLVEIQQFLKSRETQYKDKTIFFVMDMCKRAVDCQHTTREGMSEVMCKITAQTIAQPNSVAFTMTVPDFGPKNFCVGKQFVPLVYSLFFITRFQDCVIQKIKREPDSESLAFKNYFAVLEKAMRYVAYHMP